MSIHRVTEACSETHQLHAIGRFPRDYTRNDLIRYVTALELMTHENLTLVGRLQARIKHLEKEVARYKRQSAA